MIEINLVGFFGVTQGNIFRQKHFVVDASTDLCIQVASKKDQLKLLKLLRSNKTMSNEKQFRKYRKKPVIIEAYQTDEEIEIETLEGTMKANKGDFIIRGVKGELYPCKEDIFYETYEKV